MKKLLLISICFLFRGAVAIAQNDDPPAQEGKLQERMREYIMDHLGLSRNEAERFTPVFIRYFREFAQTARLYKADRLILQQKIIELRLRYRTEFRQIMDESRANKVYKYEDEFRREALRILQERRIDRPIRRDRVLFKE